MKRKKLRYINIFAGLAVCITAAVISINVFAEAVTDTIAVRIGYSGMELSEYVEVGNYHWSEIASDLPVYEQAFSYYQGGGSGSPEFTEIVDSARGVALLDFLEYADVYYGDIYNLQFYVVDHAGIQAAFDRDALFCSRYYFEDYNGHLARTYDDDFNVISVDSSECWDYCESVEPMLALEDNWVSFTQEFEHAYPDFEHASTASRFRLLFGQTFPEESLTSSSAKYVSCVYVTLRGNPEIGEMPELDGSYGSHEISVDVSVKSNMRDLVSEFISMNSTDENVLVIRSVTMEADPFYEDVAHLTISYDIVGEGSASITANYGSGGGEIASSETVTAGKAEETPEDNIPEESAPENNKPKDNTVQNNSRVSDPGKKDNTKNSGTENRKSGQKNKPDDSDASSVKNDPDTRGNTSQIKSDNAKPSKSGDKANDIKVSSVEVRTFSLSDEVQEQLRGDSTVPQFAEATEDITEVKIEEKSEESKREKITIALLTVFCGTLLAWSGGVWETLSFRRRMRRR